jgi:hypothetical protein
MAYNRKNHLKKIIEVQNIVLDLKHKDEDIYFKNIYHQHIYPKYKISYRTFHTYLGINAKKELKELEQESLTKS